MAFSIGMLLCCGKSQLADKRLAEQTIELIEAFQAKEGHLPADLGELHVTEGPVYYQLEPGGYIIWYGAELGSSWVYDSKTKLWTKRG